jgi:hypothetical protein
VCAHAQPSRCSLGCSFFTYALRTVVVVSTRLYSLSQQTVYHHTHSVVLFFKHQSVCTHARAPKVNPLSPSEKQGSGGCPPFPPPSYAQHSIDTTHTNTRARAEGTNYLPPAAAARLTTTATTPLLPLAPPCNTLLGRPYLTLYHTHPHSPLVCCTIKSVVKESKKAAGGLTTGLNNIHYLRENACISRGVGQGQKNVFGGEKVEGQAKGARRWCAPAPHEMYI